MAVQLIALSEGPCIPLDKPIVLIGRHQECDIQIPSRKISRRHCCVAQVSNYLVVRDLGSTNGIRVNGTRVLEGQLRGGDELTIGNLAYRVQWDEHLIAPGHPKAAPPRKFPGPADRRAQESGDDPIALGESMQRSVVPRARPALPDPPLPLDMIPHDPPSHPSHPPA